MADPTKPLDRARPFRRINNEKFRPKKKPDGKGVACGCRTVKSLGDLDAKLDEFLKDTPLLGVVLKVKKFIDDALDPKVVAQTLFEALRKEVGDALAIVFTSLIMLAGGPLIVLAQPVKVLIDSILGPVEKVARALARVVAKPMMLRAIRVMPQWVSVTPGAANDVVGADQVIEVEGICTRSFGNPIDVPFVNWHRWFAWNVQIEPEKEYENAPSRVAEPANTRGMQGSERSIIRPGSFEIQWDAGALQGAGGRAAFDGGFEAKDAPKHDGPMIVEASSDTGQASPVFWPMPGMFVWAAGRHVYDCSRVDDDKSDNPGMCAMIQPARAMATARFQGFQFRENGTFFVPAVEFVFVASKRGGYIDHASMADSDYEFILDLPPVELDASPYPIGNTDRFPHNTIVLRPRLLRDLRFIQGIDGSQAEPKIEVIRPDDPTKAPSQVKITIPQGALAGDAYGFRLALGWHDPAREQARRVKLCRIALNSVRMRLTDRDSPTKKLRDLLHEEEAGLKDALFKELDKISIHIPILGDLGLVPDIHPFQLDVVGPFLKDKVLFVLDLVIDAIVGLLPTEGEEEWLLRVGVNGTWVAFFFEPGRKETHTFNAFEVEFPMALVPGDTISFSAHGTEFDPVGDIMHSAVSNRTLKFRDGGARVPWPSIVKPASDAQLDEFVFDYMRKTLFDTTEGIGKMSMGLDNHPLGLVDPDPRGNTGFSQQNNPMVIRDTFDDPLKIQRLARLARAIPPEMVLVEDTRDKPLVLFPEKPDYDLRCTIEMKDQIPKDGPPAG
ncbi:MAG: hypothetical protein U1E86_19120 [Burkholderiaceae bacterium]